MTYKDQIPMWIHQVGPGWTDVLQLLHRELSSIYPHYEVLQVKEKFGGLRVYINHAGLDDPERIRMESLIRWAEWNAAALCENCGTDSPGYRTLRNAFWMKNWCDMCRDGATGVASC